MVYHPQANELVEHFNRTLKQTLIKISARIENQNDFLAPALFAHRSSPICTIGIASFFLEYS